MEFYFLPITTHLNHMAVHPAHRLSVSSGMAEMGLPLVVEGADSINYSFLALKRINSAKGGLGMGRMRSHSTVARAWPSGVSGHRRSLSDQHFRDLDSLRDLACMRSGLTRESPSQSLSRQSSITSFVF